METPDIDLYLHGNLVAHTEPMSRGAKARIVYEESVGQNYPAETPLLSCSIPVGRRSQPSPARAFLEGLLPEGQALESMAARMREVSLSDSNSAPSAPYDAIRLLGEYGRDCAGAITVVPRDSSPPRAHGSHIPLSVNEVSQLIRNLPARPLGVDVGKDIRMSLAGAQPKLLLALLGEKWHETVDGAPSTHILKPTVSWALSSDNECVVMSLAKAAGLTTASVWVEDFDGRRAFVTERFDRVVHNKQVQRLHQEDLCQALAIRPKDKYGVGRLSGAPVSLLRRQSSRPDIDTRILFRQMVFRAVVGDEDGHCKNYGLLLNDGEVSVTPLYDSLTTVVYADLSGTMGTPIGGQTNLAKVDLAALTEEGRAFGFDDREVKELVESVTDGLRGGLEHIDTDLADPRAMEVVTDVIRGRVDKLLNGNQLGVPGSALMLDGISTLSSGTLDRLTRKRVP